MANKTHKDELKSLTWKPVMSEVIVWLVSGYAK